MQFGKTSRWYEVQAAVQSDVVVTRVPDGHGCSSLMQGLKPTLVELLVAEFAIDAVDVSVLHRACWLNQDVTNSVSLSPGHECSAGESGP